MSGLEGEGPADNELFERVAQGDPVALRLLMDRYDRLVRYTIYRASRQRCHRDPLWLDSVASEVWTDLCRSLQRSESQPVEHVHSYFIQITRRRAIDALRRRGAAPLGGGDSDPGESAQAISQQEDTVDILAGLEEVSALRDCMAQLDEPDRLLCGEIADLTGGRWRAVAERLGVPESTLRSRWARVLDRLRTCLEKKR